MSRTRHARSTVARVEALEGRQLMAFDTFIHLGPMTAAVEAAPKNAAHGWAEISSFGWGASNPVTVGSGTSGTGGGKVSVSSFDVEMKPNALDAALFKDCLTGKQIQEAEVFMFKTSADGEKVALEYDFTDVMVESDQTTDSDGDSPEQAVSFAFSSVNITYTPKTGAQGSGPANNSSSWNLGTGSTI